MDNFSYTDSVRAAFASCLPCFTTSSRSESASNPASTAANPTLAEPRSTSVPRPSSSASDLEHLLRDADSDALSLHSNMGSSHRRARRRRRPKFSLTLFGYTLFGRPPVYLSDDDDDDDDGDVGSGRRRALGTVSSSTLDSDAAPLDASTIERLTSPDHFAALAAQRESERRQLEAEEARRAERRARRQERKARERTAALMSLTGGTHPPSDADFEGFQGSGDGTVPLPFSLHQALDVASQRHPDPDRLVRGGELDEGDDADLGGESYTRKKKSSAALSASGSDSRSRTSASFSAGDASHTQTMPLHTAQYPHTEMRLPVPVKNKPQRASKRTSTVSSLTSQSTSTAPYTPVESIAEMPAVAAFPVPHERYIRDGERADFPSAGLPGAGNGRSKSLDPKAFLAHQG